MAVNILCIGDVVGKPGRSMLAEHLANLVAERRVDLVVCNAENAAGGSGLTPGMFRKMRHHGVDAVTMGDHIYRKPDVLDLLKSSDRIVRPANLSPRATGRTWTVVPTKSGEVRVGVTCLLGQMYMGAHDSPWDAVDRVLDEMPGDVRIRIVDFHAEASSEKIAMGWHLDGRASIVFGTHTHIPTADWRVLPQGTAFVSDLGMTGPYDGVLGRRRDRVLSALTTSMPTRFEVASGDPRLSGILAAVDPDTGRSESIERIEVRSDDDGPGSDGAPDRTGDSRK